MTVFDLSHSHYESCIPSEVLVTMENIQIFCSESMVNFLSTSCSIPNDWFISLFEFKHIWIHFNSQENCEEFSIMPKTQQKQIFLNT